MSKRHHWMLLLLMASICPPIRAAQVDGFGTYHPEKMFTGSVSSSLYITMRDGVRLAVRITRPALEGQPAPGRFPVIWQHALTVTETKDAAQEPTDAGLNQLPALTAYGYVVVQVARRGNGQSFGSRRGYNDRTEDDDAYEVTEWLAAQPWSSGSVGIYGCSNTGDAAMHALSARPPHLRAVFAGCFSWSKFDAMRRGGIFAQWGTGPQRTLEEDLAVEAVDGDAAKVLLRTAAEEHQKSTDLLAMWQQLPFRDSWSALVGSRFWAESSVSSYAPQLRQPAIPVYIMGGWHDELRDQGLIALLNLPGSRILIGPWRHCQNPGFELLQEMHRFFDTYLKGAALGLATEPPVHYFTMGGGGGGRWKSSSTWPVPGMRLERWFVSTATALDRHAPGRVADGTFLVHSAVNCPEGGVGPFMQPCHTAGEGLSVRSPVLTADLTITGNPVVNLPISADRPDANLFAYLEDVAADNRITVITVITEGRLKASLRAEATPPFAVPGTPWHRAYAQDAQPLQPGVAATLHFDLLPTSYVVPAGHRLQLTVMGADYRERARDPSVEGTRITLSSTPANPAWLDLPVEPGTQ
jgi:predicted acyl esterase